MASLAGGSLPFLHNPSRPQKSTVYQDIKKTEFPSIHSSSGSSSLCNYSLQSLICLVLKNGRLSFCIQPPTKKPQKVYSTKIMLHGSYHLGPRSETESTSEIRCPVQCPADKTNVPSCLPDKLIIWAHLLPWVTQAINESTSFFKAGLVCTMININLFRSKFGHVYLVSKSKWHKTPSLAYTAIPLVLHIQWLHHRCNTQSSWL